MVTFKQPSYNQTQTFQKRFLFLGVSSIFYKPSPEARVSVTEICLFMGFYYDFIYFFKVFINIHKYANRTIYISDHRKKDMCLIFNLTPILVL